jgi:tRNA dimethylallyltransferase
VHLISILGPTSSGKSSLAIDLVKELGQRHGQNSAVIISCDSRQVYKYLNIGTGKVVGDWLAFPKTLGATTQSTYEVDGIAHFLIDYIDPMKPFGLHDFLIDFTNLFDEWSKLDFEPEFVILCGGTGLYAKAIFEEYQLETINPAFQKEEKDLRNSLNDLNAKELQEQLESILPAFRSKLNSSDLQNPRRLINLILKSVGQKNGWYLKERIEYPKFESKQQFYLNPVDLKERLIGRLDARFTEGLINETTKLIEEAIIDLPRLLDLGLEYRQFYFYYLGIQTLGEYQRNILKENLSYIKSQVTWFKKQKGLIEVKELSDILEFIDTS